MTTPSLDLLDLVLGGGLIIFLSLVVAGWVGIFVGAWLVFRASVRSPIQTLNTIVGTGSTGGPSSSAGGGNSDRDPSSSGSSSSNETEGPTSISSPIGLSTDTGLRGLGTRSSGQKTPATEPLEPELSASGGPAVGLAGTR